MVDDEKREIEDYDEKREIEDYSGEEGRISLRENEGEWMMMKHAKCVRRW